ncbi:hypothetical protein MNBD_GAMMA22-1752 [hydrothermal vent metagenome]|uniref:STAS/SEC14 domain-containing protein n=1 Tax=hydrothermal vent metagenome TaxID=652676 RepID=A0A3B0ZXN5_9ZZZZ
MSIINLSTDDGSGVITTFTGDISGDELILAQKDRYSPTKKLLLLKYILADFTNTNKLELCSNDVLQCSNLSLYASKENPNICIAAVMNSDLGYGLSRMWQAYTDDIPWNAKVFRTRTEAEDWLRHEIDAKLSFS